MPGRHVIVHTLEIRTLKEPSSVERRILLAQEHVDAFAILQTAKAASQTSARLTKLNLKKGGRSRELNGQLQKM